MGSTFSSADLALPANLSQEACLLSRPLSISTAVALMPLATTASKCMPLRGRGGGRRSLGGGILKCNLRISSFLFHKNCTLRCEVKVSSHVFRTFHPREAYQRTNLTLQRHMFVFPLAQSTAAHSAFDQHVMQNDRSKGGKLLEPGARISHPGSRGHPIGCWFEGLA